MPDRAELGRRAFGRGDWSGALSQLGNYERLALDDVERVAVAAYLVGDSPLSERAWDRAHRLAIGEGNSERAARCAFWLGLDLMLRGDGARANGWFARADRFASRSGGATAGLLLLPAFLGAMGSGEPHAALDVALQIFAIGDQASDEDVRTFGLLSQGEARIALGEMAAGMRCLDEAMVSVTTGNVSPIEAGIIYCAVIDTCMKACDMHRAAQWTDALDAWCASDPALGPYRGQCLVHRSQVLMARGEWDAACDEAERARIHLSNPPHPALGFAHYRAR